MGDLPRLLIMCVLDIVAVGVRAVPSSVPECALQVPHDRAASAGLLQLWVPSQCCITNRRLIKAVARSGNSRWFRGNCARWLSAEPLEPILSQARRLVSPEQHYERPANAS